MNDYAICEREVETTRHHLTPKNRKESEVVRICEPCHRQIHAVFTNHELRHCYNTVEDIKESDEMQKFVSWIKKTDKEHIQVDETEHVSNWRE